jgi:hypothetical protein
MKTRRSFRRWLPAATALALAIVLNLQEKSTPVPARTEGAAQEPATAAMRASIDPETGELIVGVDPRNISNVSDKADEAAIAEMLSRSDEGLEPVHHPDGRVSVHLQGRFMNASLARIDADGKLETMCTDHAGHAHEFLDASAEVDAYGREVR